MIASCRKNNRTLMTLIFMIFEDWICEHRANLRYKLSMITSYGVL